MVLESANMNQKYECTVNGSETVPLGTVTSAVSLKPQLHKRVDVCASFKQKLLEETKKNEAEQNPTEAKAL